MKCTWNFKSVLKVLSFRFNRGGFPHSAMKPSEIEMNGFARGYKFQVTPNELLTRVKLQILAVAEEVHLTLFGGQRLLRWTAWHVISGDRVHKRVQTRRQNTFQPTAVQSRDQRASKTYCGVIKVSFVMTSDAVIDNLEVLARGVCHVETRHRGDPAVQLADHRVCRVLQPRAGIMRNTYREVWGRNLSSALHRKHVFVRTQRCLEIPVTQLAIVSLLGNKAVYKYIGMLHTARFQTGSASTNTLSSLNEWTFTSDGDKKFAME